MEKYDSYKDSGVQWLGEIPSHWEMKRWRFLMEENTVKNTNSIIKTQLQFRYGEIVRKANQSEESDVLETISNYTVVEPHDIMINGLNLNYDLISQRVARVRENGVITSAYISLRPTKIANSKYYTYFLKSMDNKKMFHGMGAGVRLTLSYNELKNQFIPFPPLSEQTTIAAYLDSSTSKIDTAIAQQQKMIDLLNERKQIIINNAVTKGINPNVKMKDSGVEWIGMIPEKWEVCALKHYCILTNGDRGPNYPSGDDIKDSGVFFATADNIHGLRIEVKDSTKYITKEKYNVLRGAKLRKGDIVFCLRGAGFGNCAINDLFDEGTIASSLVNITPVNIDCEFMNYVLHSAYIRIQELISSNGSCADNVSAQDLGDYLIVVPKIEEQKDIVNAIASTTLPIDGLINNTKKQIALLQERKQIIINEVVTGKVKVS